MRYDGVNLVNGVGHGLEGGGGTGVGRVDGADGGAEVWFGYLEGSGGTGVGRVAGADGGAEVWSWCLVYRGGGVLGLGEAEDVVLERV